MWIRGCHHIQVKNVRSKWWKWMERFFHRIAFLTQFYSFCILRSIYVWIEFFASTDWITIFTISDSQCLKTDSIYAYFDQWATAFIFFVQPPFILELNCGKNRFYKLRELVCVWCWQCTCNFSYIYIKKQRRRASERARGNVNPNRTITHVWSIFVGKTNQVNLYFMSDFPKAFFSFCFLCILS